MRFSPGDSVGRFVVESLLGEGGMGEVYVAADERLERKVALKVLRKGTEDDGETWGRAVARMLREARAVAALSHPNIVGIYDVGEHDGTPFIAMEFVRGTSMRELVSAGRPRAERIRALLDVARALAAAHKAGLIHRDIKPENVIVQGDGTARVLDFGVARRASMAADPTSVTVDGALATVTAEGSIVGTPAYMAPEQLRGEPVDPRVDQFAWGILAYELLFGHRPFRGGPTAVTIAASILNDEPALIPGVPAPVMDVVLRALRKKPDDRFASMDELVAQLSSAAAAQPASPGEALETLEGPAVTGPSGESVREPTTRAPPPRAWRRWAVALASALTITAGALALRPRERASSPALAPGASAAEVTAPAPTPTSVTDLSTPVTESAEARLAFREGMQAIRDATWGTAVKAFDRARKADPGLAAAHMRSAVLGVSFDVTKAREAFRKASGLRLSLSERDQGFLDALEPVVQSEPADYIAAARKMDALAQRFPGDAELVFWSARLLMQRDGSSEGTERALAQLNRCVGLDPLYADCWQTKGSALAELGRSDEASAALAKCIEVSPGALDCLQDRIWNDIGSGRCADAVKNIHQWRIKEPDAPRPYSMLSQALYAMGEPEGTVVSAFDQAAKLFKAQGNELMAAHMAIARAAAFGDFAAASQTASAAASLRSSLPIDELGLAIERIFLEIEVGHAAKAGSIADEFFRNAALRPGIITTEKGVDPSVFMHSIRLRAGTISRSEYVRLRTEWIDKRMKEAPDAPWVTWTLAYAAPAWTAEDAKEAIAQEAAFNVEQSKMRKKGGLGLLRAKVYALAGNVEVARPIVEQGARACSFIGTSTEHNRYRALLGALREAAGDKPGACSVYKEVLSRWGRASASITVKDVTRRAKALGCGL